jgi:hypothetical protein
MRSLSSFAPIALVLCGCQSFDRAEFARLSGRTDARVDSSSTDARADARPADGGSAECAQQTRSPSPGCTLSVIPTVPMGLRNSVDNARPVRVFAARAINFGSGGAWQSIGFDRDGLCSTISNPMDVPCRSSLPQIDGMNGRDNTFGSVITSITAFGTTFDETRLNRSIMRGTGTIGLRLRDFGGRDDGSITADLIPLVDGHPPGRAADPPAWDGRDEWSINRGIAYGLDGTTARITTSDAFTSCGTFVAPFPNTSPIYFNNDLTRSQLTLTDIRLVGSFDASNNLPAIDLSALWVRAQIFEDLRSFGACRGLLSERDYLLLTTGVEAALDLPASGIPNPEAACSAMSIGFRIELAPVTIAGDAPDPPPIVRDLCADAGR